MPQNIEDCDCGFKDAADPTGSVFSSFFALNFSSTAGQQLGDFFIPAGYDVTQSDSPYSRNFDPAQVQFSDEGLELTVSPLQYSTGDGVPHSVLCGQVLSRDARFFHGSYHAKIRVANVPGTVAAFFNYKNDTSEVDIEYLSSGNDPTLMYSTKPQIYSANQTPSNLTYLEQSWSGSAGSFDDSFHDWSFVWLPNITYFGLDKNYSISLTHHIPQVPGRLDLSHWSDGNPRYSLGPPTKNSTMTVSLLWATYNDANATQPACKLTSTPCTIVDGVLGVLHNGNVTAVSAGGKTAPNGIQTIQEPILINAAQTVQTGPLGWLSLAVMFLYWFGWK